MTTFILAEDQALVRQGLKLMIESDEEFFVTAEATNGREAIELCEKYHPDVVILDIRMPEMTGLEAARILRERWPEMIILMLTTFNDEEYALEAFKNKVNGYLLKDGDAEELIQSIKSALSGGLSIEAKVAAKVMPSLISQQKDENLSEQLEELTKREIDVLKLIGQGKNNQEIANALYLSVGTIKNQISTILTKLNLRDRTQLAIYALKHHIV